MTHEEDEIRRAFEARSAAPTPEFRSRLSQSLGTRPFGPNVMPAIAAVTVLVLTVTSVGVLIAARQLGRSHNTAASGASTESPSPSLGPVGGFAFQLSVPSANVVWALYNPDKLYRSTDRANGWQIRSMPKDFGAHAMVSFLNDREGWWLAEEAPPPHCDQEAVTGIWHTVDAGATWQQLLATGISPLSCKDGIWFSDPLHGFVTTYNDSQPPIVFRTADGGKTWAASEIQDPAYFQSQPGGFTLHVDWVKQFGSTVYIEAFGSQDRPGIPRDNQFVLRSSDRGATWTYMTKVSSRAVVMVTETRWLDFTTPGQAMESTNGGQQFHQFASDLTATDPGATQFVFADANVGYAASPGRLQRTVDGGSHWTLATTPGAAWSVKPTPSVTASPLAGDAQLSAPSTNVAWALVGGGFLFRSTDQGNTWQQRTMPQFRAGGGAAGHIAFADDHDGWVFFVVDSPDCTSLPATPTRRAVQQGVQVFGTTDGAVTWTLVSSSVQGQISDGGLPLDECKTAFDFSDPQHGFVGTTDLVDVYVWRTSDGGATWKPTQLPHPAGWTPDLTRPRTIKSFGVTAVVYCNPYLWQSSDWGATWTLLPHGMVTPLVIVTPLRWLVMFPGSTTETLDGGATWHDFTTDYQADPARFIPGDRSDVFVFADDSVGYGTDQGHVIRTRDGGAHWELIKTSWP